MRVLRGARRLKLVKSKRWKGRRGGMKLAVTDAKQWPGKLTLKAKSVKS